MEIFVNIRLTLHLIQMHPHMLSGDQVLIREEDHLN